MADPFLGEIRIFPFNFAPVGWAQCNGQLLPISQNTALFSLLGVYYGGNGTSNFALPNLQGNIPVDQGQGPGLSFYDLGQTGGTTTVTLLTTQLPNHSHTLNADKDIATSGSPAGAIYMKGHFVASGVAGQVLAYSSLTPNAAMSPSAVGPVGGGAAHNNMMPYLTLNFCIAMQGVFPPRS